MDCAKDSSSRFLSVGLKKRCVFGELTHSLNAEMIQSYTGDLNGSKITNLLRLANLMFQNPNRKNLL